MLVPGVSGGTIAILLGIYDQLLYAGATLFSDFKKNAKLLFGVALGGILGFVLMADLLGVLLRFARLPTLYFFIGIVAAGTCCLLVDWIRNGISVPMILLGIAIVLLLRRFPSDIFVYNDTPIVLKFVIMLVAGLLLGAALILPGISFSMTLMSLGIYENLLEAIREADIYFLLPLGFSTLFGVIVLARLLAEFLRRYPRCCRGLIFGFVLASIGEIFPKLPQGAEIIWCGLLMLTGGVMSVVATVIVKRKRA